MDDMGNKEIYEFPVNQMFAVDEGDGKIQRDILVGSTQPMGEPNTVYCQQQLKADKDIIYIDIKSIS